MARNGDLQTALKVIESAVKTAEKTGSPLLEIIRETRQEIQQMLHRKNKTRLFDSRLKSGYIGLQFTGGAVTG